MAGRHDRDPDRLVVAPKVDQIGFPRVTEPPGFGAQRLWLAFTALSAFSVCRTIWYNFKGKREKSVAAAASSSASTARSPEAFSDSARGCHTRACRSGTSQDVLTCIFPVGQLGQLNLGKEMCICQHVKWSSCTTRTWGSQKTWRN
ncbi:unnamed protein product [Linum tenue]|uniref:Uncharacterized protein n=1 Tax=Linum tenue TaxID=586396 RepID=A0AAV0RNP5_9ROSI|nr:unnamed protein product [Linum tenue]